jgi:hypothetical protein
VFAFPLAALPLAAICQAAERRKRVATGSWLWIRPSIEITGNSNRALPSTAIFVGISEAYRGSGGALQAFPTVNKPGRNTWGSLVTGDRFKRSPQLEAVPFVYRIAS